MYRPGGWQEMRKKAFVPENSWIVEDTGIAYEAGADAECDGIIKKIESMPHGTTHCDILRVLKGEDES